MPIKSKNRQESPLPNKNNWGSLQKNKFMEKIGKNMPIFR